MTGEDWKKKTNQRSELRVSVPKHITIFLYTDKMKVAEYATCKQGNMLFSKVNLNAILQCIFIIISKY
jgi:hypothetical protein